MRYVRIGPIRVSLHNLDRKHDCLDLSVLFGSSRLDRRLLRRNERVWIYLNGNSTPLRLVADRIGRNEVHGYLSNYVPKPAPTLRTKNSGSKTRGRNVAESRTPRQQHGD